MRVSTWPSNVFTYLQYSNCKTKLTYATWLTLLQGDASLACIWLKVGMHIEVHTSIHNCQVTLTEACYTIGELVWICSQAHTWCLLTLLSTLNCIIHVCCSGYLGTSGINEVGVLRPLCSVISQQLHFFSFHQFKLCDTTKTFQ